MEIKSKHTGFEIAVIGMAGRFPQAKNLEEFQDNLKNGIESISFLTDEDIKKHKIAPALLENPKFVKTKGGVLEDKEYFDASFFGYRPGEAEIMDPQFRLFHECSWQALEDAGYDPDSYDGEIGIYAGASSNFRWKLLTLLTGKMNNLGQFAAFLLTDKDFFVTRTAYSLNLKGPAVVTQTLCSTSLASIHMASRALLTGECDIALAGGVRITSDHEAGYLYQEGMIESSDGHCRAFDAKASGTVGGDGIGVVVLKRLKHALAHRDNIYAVILGSAVNNDGKRKVGFTAPSIEAQANVIKKALRIAHVEHESITYIETHGTGTQLGDTIEIEALKLAFDTNKKQFCRLGSVKTNIGHLDAAAGVAGFIKTVFALKHRLIPPSLNFETPNPKIDFENSPFYVNTVPSEWKNDKYPLRAGVSSFGIGGTNVHVILEQAPIAQNAERQAHGAFGQGRGGVFPPRQSREYQLILLSAKTQSALDKMTANLAGYFRTNPRINFADAVYTLQVGRKTFTHRRMVVASDVNEAAQALSLKDPAKMQTAAAPGEKPPVVFMFPGQGSQYVNMGLELYNTEPLFRQEIDRCFEILTALVDYNLKEILYPSSVTSVSSVAKNKINQTEITQPVIFAFEYALAKLLIKWGIQPYAMIGHSIGEYAAACLSNVFSLEDALKLAAIRGKLMQEMPAGAMLSIFLPENEVLPLLNEELSLAAVNGPGACVVSGTIEAIRTFEQQSKKKGGQTRRLHTSHAFHSNMMDPILKRFETAAAKVTFNKPGLPYISNVTGNWITEGDAADPAYWAKHLRGTVRFGCGLNQLMKEENAIFVEVGPGRVLSSFVNKHPGKKPKQKAINLVRHPQEKVFDDYFLLNKVGHLWLYGQTMDWSVFHPLEKRNRISLPTYPFEGQYYPVEGDPFKIAEGMFSKFPVLRKKSDIADWFYIPSWERQPINTRTPGDFSRGSCWLVFTRDNDMGTGDRLVNRLIQDNHEVFTVKAGTVFNRNDYIYAINPQIDNDYHALFKELRELKKIPNKILHLWNVDENDEKWSCLEEIDSTQDLGFYSLLNIVQSIGRENITQNIRIMVVTNHMQEVIGEEVLCPGKATVLGAVKVIPMEYPNISCRSLDIVLPGPGSGSDHQDKLIDRILAEFISGSDEPVLAFRGNHRWVRRFKPHPLSKTEGVSRKLKEGGRYLVTGGLGGIGLTLAEHLARTIKAKLILIGRSRFPKAEEWNHWLANHNPDDPVSLKILKMMELEGLGSEIMVCCADVADPDRMQAVAARAEKRFGKINGVIHAAGTADYGGVIQRRTPQISKAVMAPKVKGTIVLDRILKDLQPDFVVLCSSMASILAPFGQAAYCAANAFLDSFALYKSLKNDTWTAAINWDTWQDVGMAVDAKKQLKGKSSISLEHGILPSEGIDVFNRILEAPLPRVAVSTKDLRILMKQGNASKAPEPRQKSESINPYTSIQPRPDISTEFVAPGCDVDKIMAQIWQEYLGIEEVGIYDNFFDLGANSLDIVQVNRKLEQVFEKNITVVTMFTNPTIDSLRRYLTQAQASTGFSHEEVNRMEKKNQKGRDKLTQRKKAVRKN